MQLLLSHLQRSTCCSWKRAASVGDAAFLMFGPIRLINITMSIIRAGNIYRSVCQLQTRGGNETEASVLIAESANRVQPPDQQRVSQQLVRLGMKLLVRAVGNESQLIHLPRAPKCQLSLSSRQRRPYLVQISTLLLNYFQNGRLTVQRSACSTCPGADQWITQEERGKQEKSTNSSAFQAG